MSINIKGLFKPVNVFTLIGSCIFVYLFAIVAYNFINDSRILHPEQINNQVSNDNLPKVSEVENKEDSKTINVKRPSQATAVIPSVTQKPEETKPPNDKKKIIILIQDYTNGLSGAADEVVNILIANGYQYVQKNKEFPNLNVKSTIVDLSDKAEGKQIKGILPIANYAVDIQPDTKIDVLIKVGEDYKPRRPTSLPSPTSIQPSGQPSYVPTDIPVNTPTRYPTYEPRPTKKPEPTVNPDDFFNNF